MTFDDAFERLIGHEGEFSKLATDKGNWTGGKVGRGEIRGTKFGISAAAYPHLEIVALTLEDARGIYLADYWLKVRANEVPPALSYPLFDLAVNSGVHRAIVILQQAVAAEPDGMFGPKTMHAVKGIAPAMILRRMDAYRLLLMTEDPAWPTFGRGWVIRVAQNALLVT